MTPLKGRVALVTGAGQGVGEGVARRLAAAGAQVVVAEYNTERGQQVAEELARGPGDGLFIHTDIRQQASTVAAVEQTIDRLGRLDVLVNNAYPTGSPPRRLEDREFDGFQLALSAGFESVWWTMKAAYPAMAAQQYGRVINMCSLNGVNAHPYTADYNSAKGPCEPCRAPPPGSGPATASVSMSSARRRSPRPTGASNGWTRKTAP